MWREWIRKWIGRCDGKSARASGSWGMRNSRKRQQRAIGRGVRIRGNGTKRKTWTAERKWEKEGKCENARLKMWWRKWCSQKHQLRQPRRATGKARGKGDKERKWSERFEEINARRAAASRCVVVVRDEGKGCSQRHQPQQPRRATGRARKKEKKGNSMKLEMQRDKCNKSSMLAMCCCGIGGGRAKGRSRTYFDWRWLRRKEKEEGGGDWEVLILDTIS